MGVHTISRIMINKPGLHIYRTCDVINFSRDESCLYEWNQGEYLLKDFETGSQYKHFILCDSSDADMVKNVIEDTHKYRVTGSGDWDSTSGKWRIWFIKLDQPTSGDGVFINNVVSY